MDNFGELLSQMLQFLRERRGERVQDVVLYVSEQVKVSTSALNKWREGTLKPNFTAIETLLRIGLNEAHMNQQWATAFLDQSKHPQAAALLERYTSRQPTQDHHLPRRLYTKYVGRDELKRAILEDLRAICTRGVIPITGFEGAGKSALALEIAWHLIEEPPLSPDDHFDHIIWISADKERLLPAGKGESFVRSTTAADVYTAIARALNDTSLNFTLPPSPEKNRELYRLLRSNGRILLILDDLDEMDEADIRQLTVFLQSLPLTTKAIITARWNHGWMNPFLLQPLDDTYMVQVIQKEAAARAVTLNDEQQKRLVDLADGIPLVAWFAIGKMAMGFGFRTVEQELDRGHDELLRFLFEDFFKILQERYEEAFHVLLALSFFDYSAGASIGALASICELDTKELPQLLELLDARHLGEYHSEPNERPHLLRMTQKYVAIFEQEQTPKNATPEWIQKGQQWLQQARQRWLHWYLSFVDHYNHDIAREWQTVYSYVNLEWANLLKAFNWCMQSPDRAPYLADFWLEARDGLLRYADICGYWQDRRIILQWLLKIDQHLRDTHEKNLLTDFMRAKALSSLAMTAILQLQKGNEVEIQSWLDEAFALVGEPHDEDGFDLRCRLWEAQAFLASRIHDATHEEVIAILDYVQHDWAGVNDVAKRKRREAEYWYRLGTIHFVYDHFDEAETVFHHTLTEFGAMRQRTELACYCWLADIALQHGDVAKAHDYLDQHFQDAYRNGEKRRIATFQRLYGQVYAREQDMHKAHEMALAAYHNFHNLGMIEETAKTLTLLHQIDPAVDLDAAVESETGLG